MTTPPALAVSVLLAAADGESLASLRSAVEILASFGIGATTAVLLPGEPLPPLAAGVCAVIVASPDAALPAALAVRTALPVIRVPIPGDGRTGAALLNDGSGDLPAGPADGEFATMAIGEAGAKNAALFVVSALAVTDPQMRAAWREFRTRQTDAALRHPPLEAEV